jgi:antitoxin VapB
MGESLTEAVLNALRERLERERRQRRTPGLRDELRAIRERCAKLPVLDTRSPEEILGYDTTGTPCKTSGEPLLYKGNDFPQTDIALWTFPQQKSPPENNEPG